MKNKYLKKKYKEIWNYLKESKNYIYSVFLIFLIFIVLGSLIPVPDSISKIILEFIEELLLKTQGMSFSELTSFIFLNNLQSSFFGMLYGIFLGIFPLLSTAANGYLLGFVALEVIRSEGFFVLWRILPHGIFELPALFVSLGLGVKLGSFIFQKEKIKSLKIYFIKSLEVFFFVVIPLLIIAAFIEGFLVFFVG